MVREKGCFMRRVKEEEKCLCLIGLLGLIMYCSSNFYILILHSLERQKGLASFLIRLISYTLNETYDAGFLAFLCLVL